ncbi:MAG: C13 family peptidase [Gemmatimonadales bacterium]
MCQLVAAQSELLIVSGLGGDRGHRDMFYEWSSRMIRAATERFGIPDTNITYLAESPERDTALIDGKSSKTNIEAALRRLARKPTPDGVFILLIGHGSYQGGESKLSLPGPDMTASDFARAIDQLAPSRVVIANVSSASGAFMATLSGPGRTVITATKSAFERDEATFGRYFVEAYANDVADVDKDDRVSVLEAFQYARREVIRAYEADKQLLTEHAQLDDNGDGKGSSEPNVNSLDGALAASMFLIGHGNITADAPDDPELAALYEKQRTLQKRIADLRALKNKTDRNVYETELEKLLLELARTAHAIRDRKPEHRIR